jgi:DNA replication protein DnaC
MRQAITEYRKKLRLSHSLIEIYDEIEFKDKDQFILDLLTKLYEERKENIISRNLQNAKFPVVKSFDGYLFDGIEFPGSLNLKELKGLSFIDNRENLILYGNVGVGKTHLASAIGLSVINEGKVVYFFTLHDLVNQLLDAKETRTIDKLMRKLLKADMIILDEWGYLPLHQEGARLLFELISKCYEQKSLIITTNLEFSHWKSFLFDEKLTLAIIDRIIHHSHLLLFNKESYRKRYALTK